MGPPCRPVTPLPGQATRGTVDAFEQCGSNPRAGDACGTRPAVAPYRAGTARSRRSPPPPPRGRRCCRAAPVAGGDSRRRTLSRSRHVRPLRRPRGPRLPALRPRRPRRSRRSLDDRGDDPPRAAARLRPAACGAAARTTSYGATRARACRRGARGERRSLAFFGQLTDPQIADEMSPARVDFIDPAGNEVELLVAADGAVRPAGLRPDRAQRQRQPARARCAAATAAARGSASPSRPATSPTTSSSTRRAGSRACSTAAGSTRSRASRSAPTQPVLDRPGDDRPAQRRRGGAARTPAWPTTTTTAAFPPTATTASGIPDEAPPGGGPYAAFPRYPGLLERAQQPFTAEGLDVPWYIARGNHDGLIQGNAPASADLFRSIAVGCLKVFPSAALDPARFSNADDERGLRADRATRRSSRRCWPARAPCRRTRTAGSSRPRSTSGRSAARTATATSRPPSARASDGVAAYYAFRPRARDRADLARHRRRGRRPAAATSTTRSTAGSSARCAPRGRRTGS